MCILPNLAAEVDHEDGEEEAAGDDDQPQHVGHNAARPEDLELKWISREYKKISLWNLAESMNGAGGKEILHTGPKSFLLENIFVNRSLLNLIILKLDKGSCQNLRSPKDIWILLFSTELKFIQVPGFQVQYY